MATGNNGKSEIALKLLDEAQDKKYTKINTYIYIAAVISVVALLTILTIWWYMAFRKSIIKLYFLIHFL